MLVSGMICSLCTPRQINVGPCFCLRLNSKIVSDVRIRDSLSKILIPYNCWDSLPRKPQRGPPVPTRVIAGNHTSLDIVGFFPLRFQLSLHTEVHESGLVRELSGKNLIMENSSSGVDNYLCPNGKGQISAGQRILSKLTRES